VEDKKTFPESLICLREKKIVIPESKIAPSEWLFSFPLINNHQRNSFFAFRKTKKLHRKTK